MAVTLIMPRVAIAHGMVPWCGSGALFQTESISQPSHTSTGISPSEFLHKRGWLNAGRALMHSQFFSTSFSSPWIS